MHTSNGFCGRQAFFCGFAPTKAGVGGESQGRRRFPFLDEETNTDTNFPETMVRQRR